MNTLIKLLWGSIPAFAIFMLLSIATLWAISARAATLSPDILEIVKISGEIDAGTANLIADKVDTINKSKLIKAVLLELDTPGGGVLASSNIYDSLSKLKVPVVVWCDSMCASGGMYISMAPTVKFIAIRHETIAGSIGVIMHMSNYNRLLDWMRIDNTNFKSGMYKDTGDPSRALNADDIKYLQALVDKFAGEFYGLVDKARGPKITDWAAIKSARIFIGADAQTVGLVDGIMNEDQAIAKAKELSGSKAIFTRDEIKEVANASDGNSGYGNHYEAPTLTFQSDLQWGIEKLKSILTGQEVEFKYELPMHL